MTGGAGELQVPALFFTSLIPAPEPAKWTRAGGAPSRFHAIHRHGSQPAQRERGWQECTQRRRISAEQLGVVRQNEIQTERQWYATMKFIRERADQLGVAGDVLSA